MGAIAKNLRRYRSARELTLAQLAARSGVAKSTLSQIEAGSTNPTLGTLAALSDALGTRIEELIATPEALQEVRVVRRTEGKDISDDAISGRLVTAFPVPAALGEFHHLTLLPDHAETSASHGMGSREHVIVLDGRARVGPVGAEVELETGDYATYSADGPHAWQALGGLNATVWLLAIYPTGAN